MNHKTDVIIIGAGIAGLAAAIACRNRGLDVVVLDRGPPLDERNRIDPSDIASGVGGAGLFSDGKFSFFPSATKLWHLKPQKDLIAAYDWFRAVIGSHQIEAPPFPLPLSNQAEDRETSSFIEKNYNSQYMSPTARTRMIAGLLSDLGTPVRSRTSVRNIIFGEKCQVEVVGREAQEELHTTIEGKAIVLGSGRLGPLLLHELLPPALQTFQRLEIGVRIEQPAAKFFLRDCALLDPKRIWIDPVKNREWRTFCCCREGEVVSVWADNVLSVSGRSDVPATGRSSVGFHVRLLDRNIAEKAWAEFKGRSERLRRPATEPLDTFLKESAHHSNGLGNLLGPVLQSALKHGLSELLKVFPDAANDATLHGPAVEGVVYYPRVSSDLRVSELPLWVAGDACGQFRGITAAGVSGYFSGLRVSRFLGMMV